MPSCRMDVKQHSAAGFLPLIMFGSPVNRAPLRETFRLSQDF
uniref:Uncharacterized protein n=1 Tax=Anguilla anguilla TaxID=7936 RepID=A0A0E9T021_ANGAN